MVLLRLLLVSPQVFLFVILTLVAFVLHLQYPIQTLLGLIILSLLIPSIGILRLANDYRATHTVWLTDNDIKLLDEIFLIAVRAKKKNVIRFDNMGATYYSDVDAEQRERIENLAIFFARIHPQRLKLGKVRNDLAETLEEIQYSQEE
jgi:hypothetical protein